MGAVEPRRRAPRTSRLALASRTSRCRSCGCCSERREPGDRRRQWAGDLAKRRNPDDPWRCPVPRICTKARSSGLLGVADLPRESIARPDMGAHQEARSRAAMAAGCPCHGPVHGRSFGFGPNGAWLPQPARVRRRTPWRLRTASRAHTLEMYNAAHCRSSPDAADAGRRCRVVERRRTVRCIHFRRAERVGVHRQLLRLDHAHYPGSRCDQLLTTCVRSTTTTATRIAPAQST